MKRQLHVVATTFQASWDYADAHRRALVDEVRVEANGARRRLTYPDLDASEEWLPQDHIDRLRGESITDWDMDENSSLSGSQIQQLNLCKLGGQQVR